MHRPALVLLLLGCAPSGPAPDDVADASDEDTDDTERPETDTDTDTDTDPPPPTDALVVIQRPTCADAPRAEARFDRQTFTLEPATERYFSGGTSSMGDLDGDGDLDVVLVGAHQIVVLWQQAGAFTEQEILRSGTTEPYGGLFGVAIADVEADGDLDLYVTGIFEPNHLLLNDGSGTFTDGTAAANVALASDHPSATAMFWDVDADQDLDLFVAGHGLVDEVAIATLPPEERFEGTIVGKPSHLLLNDGSGRFTDVSDTWLDPALQDGLTFLAVFADLDDDGDDDLYFANDFGQVLPSCRVGLREGNRFVFDDNVLSLEARQACMGIGLGQLLPNEPQETLVLTAWAWTAMYTSRTLGAGPRWFEVARSRGFWPNNAVSGRRQFMGWGAEIADLDLDGDGDVAVSFGHLATGMTPNPEDQQDGLWIQQSTGAFLDEAEAWGVNDTLDTRNVTVGDLDADGWLDLVKVGVEGEARVYLSRCAAGNWLQVALHQDGPNPNAIGATVRATAGERTWHRRLRAGGTGYGSTQPATAHFGLADATAVDLEVTWPDGGTSRFEAVPAGSLVRVDRAPR